jgi:hypothetical protein
MLNLFKVGVGCYTDRATRLFEVEQFRKPDRFRVNPWDRARNKGLQAFEIESCGGEFFQHLPRVAKDESGFIIHFS